MTENEAMQVSVAYLAWLGDAVMELLVRERLILDKKGDVHNRAMQFVTAQSQSEAAERLLNEFTENETVVYKRGRNSTHTAPKSATHAQYSRATGLECVFGYLHLIGDADRLLFLFSKGFE